MRKIEAIRATGCGRSCSGIWRDMPMENIGLANSLMEALASADPKQKKPVPLLKWTEEQLMTMLSAVLPDEGRRIDQL